MSRNYDNWERLVAAVLRKEQLWQLCHADSFSSGILSEASEWSSSFHLTSQLHHAAFDFSSSESSSTHWQQREEAFEKSQNLLPKLVLISEFSPAFDVEDVFLGSTELLGRGTFGSAYMAATGNGVRIVVKKLKPMSISELEFERCMEIIGNVRHENVVALRAYYSLKDEKLMLYDYCSNGSVSSLLHGQNGENPAHVYWETRLRIAIGAARGIAAIHTQDGGKLVHGNIKATNIFLNSQHYGCVSDLGLTNMTTTTFMPTARCYAPEVKNTQDVSQASDVYSFGILLLELLTRKSPIHVPGGREVVDLVKLVNSIKSKVRTAKVFDPDLLGHPSIREHMVKLLQIGISCAAKSEKKRPKMSEVVKMLEGLHIMTAGQSVSSVRHFVFLENCIATFDLEDLLRAEAEVIGKGTFGTSYKAIFENGTTVAVKRFKDLNITVKEFRQHMDAVGRMRHENVAELRAYFFSREEVLLVYDYHYQESVSALLHGNGRTGSGRTHLDWETRMKIAVGAARGIAYIHKQDGLKLVHGNIKSSNIFLNGRKYGLISDAGLAKVMNPLSWPLMRTPGYRAPEVKDTRNMSQASDVYSFGVVLLELVSGRQFKKFMGDYEVASLVKWIRSVSHDEWTAEVFDVELRRYQNEHESMVQLLQLAIDCITDYPDGRPKMPQVVKMLEEISGMDAVVQPSIESSLKDLQPSTGSRLEDLLEDLLPSLTP
ncbi:putative inactive receptor kinase [Sesamum alatum]|uniref:Inactive receptor kinase n=1 Tax=Sesamum alatum TaxID=300844 RepID=A0AAE1YKF0_9LAMI|nr:putative inactive receptor kinase [Sesamum alatum]